MPFTLDLLAETHPDSDPVLCLMRKNGEVPTEVPLRSREWAKKMVAILQQALEEDGEASKVMARSGKAKGHSAKGLLTLILQELLLARPGDPERFIKCANAASVAQAMFDAAGASFRKNEFNYNGVATMVNEFFPGANCTNKAVEDVVKLLNKLGDGYDPDKPGGSGSGGNGTPDVGGAAGSGTPPNADADPEPEAEDFWQQLEDALTVLHSQVFPEADSSEFMESPDGVSSAPNRFAGLWNDAEESGTDTGRSRRLHAEPTTVRVVSRSLVPTVADTGADRVVGEIHSHVGRRIPDRLLWFATAAVGRLRLVAAAAVILLCVGYFLVWEFQSRDVITPSNPVFVELSVKPTGTRATENFSLAPWSDHVLTALANSHRQVIAAQRTSSPGVIVVKVSLQGVPQELVYNVSLDLKGGLVLHLKDKTFALDRNWSSLIRDGDLTLDGDWSRSIRSGDLVLIAQDDRGPGLHFEMKSKALEEAIRGGLKPTIRLERIQK